MFPGLVTSTPDFQTLLSGCLLGFFRKPQKYLKSSEDAQHKAQFPFLFLPSFPGGSPRATYLLPRGPIEDLGPLIPSFP